MFHKVLLHHTAKPYVVPVRAPWNTFGSLMLLQKEPHTPGRAFSSVWKSHTQHFEMPSTAHATASCNILKNLVQCLGKPHTVKGRAWSRAWKSAAQPLEKAHAAPATCQIPKQHPKLSAPCIRSCVQHLGEPGAAPERAYQNTHEKAKPCLEECCATAYEAPSNTYESPIQHFGEPRAAPWRTSHKTWERIKQCQEESWARPYEVLCITCQSPTKIITGVCCSAWASPAKVWKSHKTCLEEHCITP